MDKKILNPYFSVEINQEKMEEVKSIIKSSLNSFNLELNSLPNPHITISYLLGYLKVQELENVAEELSEAPFEMRVVGITALKSTYYKGTIIALELEHTDDFLYTQDYLKECFISDEVKVKEYQGGFKAHISLFCIDGHLNSEDKDNLSRYLEICLQNINPTVIFGEKFCIYNQNREKIIEKNFRV